jgi:hypothetical protein
MHYFRVELIVSLYMIDENDKPTDVKWMARLLKRDEPEEKHCRFVPPHWCQALFVVVLWWAVHAIWDVSGVVCPGNCGGGCSRVHVMIVRL